MQKSLNSKSIAPKRNAARSVLFAMLAAFLSGCATMDLNILNPIQKVQMELAYFNAEALYQEGRYRKAAQTLEDTALELPPPYKEGMQIKAASFLVEGNFILNAYQVLKDIDESVLSDNELLEKRILDAYFYSHASQPEKILNILSLEQIRKGGEALQVTALGILANALSGEQFYIDSVTARIEREKLLSDPQQKEENTQALWRALISENIENINDRLALEDNRKELAAWLNLARLATPEQIDYEVLKAAYQDWNNRNSFLKLPPNLYSSLYARWEYLDFSPRRIALLLPLTGTFAKIGKAVRDGFMQEHEKSTVATTTEVTLYNTDQSDKTIVQIYQQAVTDGSDLIVGPLLKSKVEILMDNIDFTVPGIMLNYYPQESFAGRGELFQFGLLPEDEAVQIAKKIIKRGHLFALVLAPESDWGKRLSDSFVKEYTKMGGVVREVSYYDMSFSNYNAFVQSALRLDESRHRNRLVEDALEKKVNFTPRIRNDITTAVIFTNHEKGVLIYPMIKFYYGNDLPVFASSHIYDPRKNTLLRELDGIAYVDIPAVINPDTENPHSNQLKYPRLFALGEDAFHLSRLIRRVGLGNTKYKGMTGDIELRKQGRLFRNLQWAKFERGRPIPLGEGW